MSNKPITGSARLIQRLFTEGVLASRSDAELVERFTSTQDPDAFAVIVARHGPRVMAVCQGVLGSRADAEDAFQATFLVLLNRAGTFAVGPSLGGWLHRVAQRVARQSRLAETRRRRRESVVEHRGESASEEAPERSELVELIRQEIDRLPECYRVPIVLCDLQGLTRVEAAELIGCPSGTVAGRLARARQELRDRLERRGISPLIVSPLLSEMAVRPFVWRTSLQGVVKTTSALASGRSATPAVLDLAASAGRTLVGVRTVLGAVAALVVVVGVGLVASGDPKGATTPLTPPSAATPPPEPVKTPTPEPVKAPDPDDPEQAGYFVGRVLGPEDRPLAGARLFIGTSQEVRAISGPDGRFSFDAPDMTYIELDGLPARRSGVLRASADGYAPDSVVTWGQTRSSFRSHWDPVKGADLTLRLVPDDAPIHGRLLDPQGQPLAGARVRFAGLRVPSRLDLDAHLEQYKHSKNLLLFFDFRTIDPGVVKETVTDADGRFRILGMGRDRLVDLVVTAPGVVRTSLTVMTRDAPDVVIDRDPEGNPRPERTTFGAGFTLRLKPDRVVKGIVRDRDTHEPIPGVRVGPSYLISGRGRYGDGEEPPVSDATGRFSISGLDPALSKLVIVAVPQPGQPYLNAKTEVVEEMDLVIECPRGIPFRLNVTDEAGRPVEAEVESVVVDPNPRVADLLRDVSLGSDWCINQAARRAVGVYEGVVLPGPGAVLVKTPARSGNRPAHVDPKAFFAPGKTDWTAQEQISTYGTQDTLAARGGWIDQHDFSAIVLVNPPVGSKPLELSATVVRDKPRQVTLLDPAGKPVVGVQTKGLTYHPWDAEPRLRASTFPITGLHPDRARRIIFLKEDRDLIGFLLARGDGETPYTVRLHPWGVVKGRILDEDGQGLSAKQGSGKQAGRVSLTMGTQLKFAAHDDPGIGELPESTSDDEGRFRIERLVPGQRYSAEIYRGIGWYAGMAFKDLVLQPGEVRDLGDIRASKPVNVIGR